MRNGAHGRQRGVDVVLGGVLVEAESGEHPCAVLEFEEREQDVLGADVVVAQPQRLPELSSSALRARESNGIRSGTCPDAGASLVLTVRRRVSSATP